MSREQAAIKSSAVESGRRKRRTAEEINARILSATRDEFLKSGYAATSAAIAAKADVTEGQLYRYFKSKTDLFREAVIVPLDKQLLSFGTEYLAQISGLDDRKERIRLYINQLQAFIQQHPELLVILSASHGDSRSDAISITELQNLKTHFNIGSLLLEDRTGKKLTIPPKLMAKIIFSTVLSNLMFKSWLYEEEAGNGEALVEAIGSFLINGVYASVGEE